MGFNYSTNHSNCSVALVFSLVSSTWSFLRWEEVFGDLASDGVIKCSRSQRWSLLGRTFDWSRAMDARVRKASKLSLGGIVVIQLWWLLVSLMTVMTPVTMEQWIADWLTIWSRF